MDKYYDMSIISHSSCYKKNWPDYRFFTRDKTLNTQKRKHISPSFFFWRKYGSTIVHLTGSQLMGNLGCFQSFVIINGIAINNLLSRSLHAWESKVECHFLKML